VSGGPVDREDVASDDGARGLDLAEKSGAGQLAHGLGGHPVSRAIVWRILLSRATPGCSTQVMMQRAVLVTRTSTTEDPSWVGWIAHLIFEDVEGQRYWTDRQREYLARIGVRETWLTIHNMALSAAMEGEDVHVRLYEARSQANREDVDSEADTVLALAVIARLEGRPHEASELLGSITGQPLNNVAHYVLYRATFVALGDEIDTDQRDELMQRGRGQTVRDVLDAHGLQISA
jgi:hypothetical protein